MRKRLAIMISTIIISYLVSNQAIQAATKGREAYEKAGQITWEAKTDEKIVAITFDDGPSSVYTPQILDVLAKYNAKATFFIMGAHAKKYSYIVYRQALEGHELANHTYSHNYTNNDPKFLEDELAETTDVIQQITGIRPTLFRPVGGRYNDWIVHTAIENDYQIILWSWHQDAKDWQEPGVNKIVNHVTKNVRPGDIILLHDAGGNRSQTVEALDQILAFLQKKGFECVTVSELLSREKRHSPEMDPFK